MADRRIRLQEGDTPESLAKAGGGNALELWRANDRWMQQPFYPWNPGQEMVVPPAWKPLPGEYAGS